MTRLCVCPRNFILWLLKENAHTFYKLKYSTGLKWNLIVTMFNLSIYFQVSWQKLLPMCCSKTNRRELSIALFSRTFCRKWKLKRSCFPLFELTVLVGWYVNTGQSQKLIYNDGILLKNNKCLERFQIQFAFSSPHTAEKPLELYQTVLQALVTDRCSLVRKLIIPFS